MVEACVAHWSTTAMFVLPIVVIGGGLWMAGRRDAARRDAASGAERTDDAAQLRNARA